MTEKKRGGREGENENPANFLSTKNLFVSTNRRAWQRPVCVKDPRVIFYRPLFSFVERILSIWSVIILKLCKSVVISILVIAQSLVLNIT